MGYKKLVRDLIPDVIKGKGHTPVIRKLRAAEYRHELKRKLVEEAQETLNAETKKDIVDEIADIQEVLTALYAAYGIACSDVTKAARKKRKERGGFTKRLYLEGVK